MTRDVVVYGTGGVGRQAVQIIDDLNADGAAWSLVGYLDDDPARAGTELHGVPIVGAGEWLTAHAHVDVGLALGTTTGRTVGLMGAHVRADQHAPPPWK